MNHLNYSIAEAYYLAALHGYIPNEDPTTLSDLSEIAQSPSSSEESTSGVGLVAVVITALLMFTGFSAYIVQQTFANSMTTPVNGITQQHLRR